MSTRSSVQEPHHISINSAINGTDDDTHGTNRGSSNGGRDIERRGLLNDTSTGRAKPSSIAAAARASLCDIPCLVMVAMFLFIIIGLAIVSRPIHDGGVVKAVTTVHKTGTTVQACVPHSAPRVSSVNSTTHICDCVAGYHRIDKSDDCVGNITNMKHSKPIPNQSLGASLFIDEYS